jgi:hypothetical protein
MVVLLLLLSELLLRTTAYIGLRYPGDPTVLSNRAGGEAHPHRPQAVVNASTSLNGRAETSDPCCAVQPIGVSSEDVEARRRSHW